MPILGINTPELGISEFISDRLGQKRNAQGGSNLFGGQTSQPKAASYTPVLGASTSNAQSNTPYGPAIPAGFNPNAGSYSGGASSGYNVSSGGGTPPMVSSGVQGSSSLGQFDGIINDALSTLDQGNGVAQSAYDSQVAGINSQIGKQQGQAETDLNSTNQKLDQQGNEVKQGSANAVNEARRGYSEMAQGIQSKFGGSTGLGGFSESILGAQTQRNVAGFQQQLASSMQKIGDTKIQVKLLHDQLLQDLDTQKQANLADAKAKFDNTLQQIRQSKSALQAQKADWTRQAISEYQAAANRANELDTQFKQDLYQQQIAAQQKLDAAASAQQQKAQSLQLVYAKPNTQVGVFNPQTGQISPSGFSGPTGGGQLTPAQQNGQQVDYNKQLEDLLKQG